MKNIRQSWSELIGKSSTRKKRGYDFVERIKESIQAIEPRYDYILIDARTGYSDVGGICLQQLPNIVVLMFRLNGQNLEGTAKTHAALKEFALRTQKHLDVIPVISPAWPFATLEANSFVKKARTLFKPAKPLEISFDASLTFGEKIIVKDSRKYEIRPRTIDDYEALAREVRQHNLTDPITMDRAANEKFVEGQVDESFRIRCTIVERKPSNWKYWVRWAQAANELNSPEPAFSFVESQLSREPQLWAAHAIRARLRWTKPAEKITSLSKAINGNPEFAAALFDRGKILFQEGLLKLASDDFERHLALRPEGAVQLFHGICCLILGDLESAERDFRAFLERDPKDVQARVNLALTLLLTGRSEDARAECERALKLDPSDEHAKLTLVHALGRVGDREQAKTILKGLASQSRMSRGAILNIAEAYVAIEEAEEALNLLKPGGELPKDSSRYQPVSNLLLFFCNVLRGIDDEKLEKKVRDLVTEKPKVLAQLGWRYLELRAFLLFPGSNSMLTSERRLKLLGLLELYERASRENTGAASQISKIMLPEHAN